MALFGNQKSTWQKRGRQRRAYKLPFFTDPKKPWDSVHLLVNQSYSIHGTGIFDSTCTININHLAILQGGAPTSCKWSYNAYNWP